MVGEDLEILKTKFLKAFVNLPENVREDVVAIVDDKPYSWNAATIEIKNNSEIGEKILKTLKKLEIL
tara:strand:- start:762 stop:962 length:201 start_codon:yes stop_codon:yes gene_type:complete